MPLSEHEERIFAAIERQLAAEDPRLVARGRRRRWSSLPRQSRVRAVAILAVLGVVCVALLGFVEGIGGVVAATFGLALLFVAILLAVTLATEQPQRHRASVPPDERRGRPS